MKKLVGMVFAIGLMIGLMPGKIVRADTNKADVNYLKAIVGTDNVVTFETDNEECTIVKQDTDNEVVWENGWYAVTGEIEINGRITINEGADVNLILCDDCGLNAKKGIYVPLNSTLNIYSGSTEDNIKGNGKLDATGDTGYAGIGGNNGESGNCGKIVIHGGHITATGGDHGAGIGGGIKGDGGIIVIYGGTVKATGGSGASGIGIGQFDITSLVCDATLNVYGGSIEAIGGVGSFYGSEPHRVPGGAGIYCK